MRAVIAILALTMALPSAASARKVLNPSNTLISYTTCPTGGGDGWSVGKRSKTTRGAKLNSPIVIRRLPPGAYTLKVVVTLANGNKLTEHRRYRTCPRTT